MTDYTTNPEPEPTDDLWQCKECGQMYVVPTLARICEGKHDRPRK